MIKNSFKEAFSPEWLETNITNPIHELVIIQEIIPWENIISRLCRFYNKSIRTFRKISSHDDSYSDCYEILPAE